jgi:hypothetical protein
MQVNRLDKRRQRLATRCVRLHPQRRAQMEFAQTQARGRELVEAGARRLKFNGEVAAVVVHAHETQQPFRVDRAFAAPPGVEKVDRLIGRLEQTARLRFQAEVQVVAGFLRERGDGAAAGGEVGEDRRAAAGIGGDEALERGRHRADAAADARRHELHEQFEQLHRVRHALGRGPVGRVDLLLHPGAVEAAVGKSVDRENVAVVPLQPAPKRGQRVALRELGGGPLAQAQTDGVRATGGHATAHRQHMALEGGERFRPGFAAVDIRAVSEMDAGVELHPADDSPTRNFGHWERKRCGLR